MTEQPNGPEAKPLATWRPLVLWSAAIVAFLGLVWFAAAVVVPAYEVHRAIDDAKRAPPAPPGTLMAKLGGPEPAARKLSIYLSLPKALIYREPSEDQRWWSLYNDKRGIAVGVLGDCGKHGVPTLVRMLDHSEARMRSEAASALGSIGPDARDAVPALIRALSDDDHGSKEYGHGPPLFVCRSAAEALGDIGPDAAAAVAALQQLCERSSREIVRETAARAIDKIRVKRTE
jgi:hypothetical protein